MKKLNKFILGTGSIAAAVIPTALAADCGAKSASSNGSFDVKVYADRADVTDNLFHKDANSKVFLALDGATHSAQDKSFNNQAFDAISASANKGVGVDGGFVIRPAKDDQSGFNTMYASAPDKSIIVAPGFMHELMLPDYLKTNTGRGFILLDGDYAHGNVASVVFNVYQAAFLGGIAAGQYLQNNVAAFGDGGLKVATFGGQKFDSVTSFMAGFQGGVEYYNAHVKPAEGKAIEFVDLGSDSDYFSGSFTEGEGKIIANKIIQAGADVILPVAGPQTKDTLKAIKESNSKAKVIGVDVAQEDALASDAALNPTNIIFSITKNIAKAATDEINAIYGTVANDKIGFGKLYVGNLDNGLVGLSNIAGKTDTTAPVAAVLANAEYKKAAMAFKPVFKF